MRKNHVSQTLIHTSVHALKYVFSIDLINMRDSRYVTIA